MEWKKFGSAGQVLLLWEVAFIMCLLDPFGFCFGPSPRMPRHAPGTKSPPKCFRPLSPVAAALRTADPCHHTCPYKAIKESDLLMEWNVQCLFC